MYFDNKEQRISTTSSRICICLCAPRLKPTRHSANLIPRLGELPELEKSSINGHGKEPAPMVQSFPDSCTFCEDHFLSITRNGLSCTETKVPQRNSSACELKTQPQISIWVPQLNF